MPGPSEALATPGENGALRRAMEVAMRRAFLAFGLFALTGCASRERPSRASRRSPTRRSAEGQRGGAQATTATAQKPDAPPPSEEAAAPAVWR